MLPCYFPCSICFPYLFPTVSYPALISSLRFLGGPPIEFPAWATAGVNIKLFGKAKANGADELTLSDFDANTGLLEGNAGKANYADFVLL